MPLATTYVESGINTLLLTNAEVTALVADRVYPVRMPEGAQMPALVYTSISSVPVVGISGQNKLTKKRLQVDCYGSTYPDVKHLEQAVNNALINYQGTPDANSTSIESIQQLLSIDLYEDDAKLYRVNLDFEVWFVATY